MKQYRQNSHTRSLICWAVLCTATAIVLFVHGNRVVSRALKVEEILAGVALLMFGPAALAVYLLRARHVWVSVDNVRGIVVSGRRVIPWEEIRRIERKRPVFRRSSGPAEMTPVGEGLTALATNLGCESFIAGVAEVFVLMALIFAAFFAFWLLFFVIVPLILIPVLEVFAPFGDRFRIVTRKGTLVLRDLHEADDFQQQIEQRAQVVVS